MIKGGVGGNGRHALASALLVVMGVMTGLTLLLTSWWQAAGWTGDLVLVRQQYVTRFYATEAVRRYAVAWVKKSFDQVIGQLAKDKKPIIMDGGTVNLGPRAVGTCSLVIDHLPGDDRGLVVRVTVTMMVDGRVVTCHRCLVEREVGGNGQRKEVPRFVVRNVFLG